MFIKLEGGADLEPASDATQGGCQYNSGFSRVKLSSYLVSAAGFEPALVEPFIMADMPFRLYPPCARNWCARLDSNQHSRVYETPASPLSYKRIKLTYR